MVYEDRKNKLQDRIASTSKKIPSGSIANYVPVIFKTKRHHRRDNKKSSLMDYN